MSDVAAPPEPAIHALSSFDDIVDALAIVSRHHALGFRLQVGSVLLHAFFDGDFRAYQDRSPAKEARFDEFLRERHDELSRLGLSPRLARNCIRAHMVWRTLPTPVRDGLGLGQLDVLTRLGDVSARATVATAALRHGWTLQQLIDAVDTVRGGGELDAAAVATMEGRVEGSGAVDGAQELPVAVAKGTRQPGRLVSEAERWLGNLRGWEQRWQGASLRALRPAQRQRLLDAAARLEAEAGALRQRLLAQAEAERERG